MSQQIDYDKLSDAELEAMARQWAAGGAQPTEEDQPRDENGRFVPKKEDDETPAAEPLEEEIFERTIDLGDGAGVQVFQGKTMEELIDNLAKAQEHATRKIREQAALIKAQPKPQTTPTPDELDNLTDAEKFLLQQEMLTDPAKAIKKFVNRAVEERERVAAEAATRTKAEADAFVANNSNYFATPKNGQKLVKWLEINNLEATEDNLKNAFDDLSSSGLLEQRPAEVKETPVEAEGEKPVAARIEPTPVVQTVVRRKVVGGVSVKRSAPTPTQTPGLTEKQLYDMPIHELEELSRKALVGQQ